MLAVIAGLVGVKQHIVELARQGRIIDPAEWGHPSVQQLHNGQNSYSGRARARKS